MLATYADALHAFLAHKICAHVRTSALRAMLTGQLWMGVPVQFHIYDYVVDV